MRRLVGAVDLFLSGMMNNQITRDDDSGVVQMGKGELVFPGNAPAQHSMASHGPISGVKLMTMQRATIGIRVHSGWGAVVAVSGNELEVVERCRVEIINRSSAGVAQPYHFAEKRELAFAEEHIATCAAESARLAVNALRELSTRLRGRRYTIAGGVILLSSGRPLPSLEKTLTSHALIHTAEGEFFRHAFRTAFKDLGVPVTGIRERDLQQRALAVFGKAAAQITERINSLGRSLGPPWTQDQKMAALAAALVLTAPMEEAAQSA
jgi:hypothetical protein